MSTRAPQTFRRARLLALLAMFFLGSVALIARAVQLQIMDTEYLQGQGNERFLREVAIPATRGLIKDRNGEPLAVSTPVDSVAVDPTVLLQEPARIAPLAQVLGADAGEIERKLTQRANRRFVWLRRRLAPDVSSQVRALDTPGVIIQKEYKRFYPTGRVSAHLTGFTNIDDIGQEGLELAYNDWLQGAPGSKRVIKDLKGRTVEEIELIRDARPGNDLELTIDRRLQYLAYRELRRTVEAHAARAGTVVLLDVQTGEVLAMVNEPSYNPNRPSGETSGLRNRAVTDVFEPGSVMKVFSVLSALENGIVRPDTPVDTNPGYVYMAGYTIKDHHNYGVLDVTGLITKSSNVGVSQIALQLPAQSMWDTYTRFGFGNATGTGFPGESAGVLRDHSRWRRVEQATISYGYGVSVTALQLAQAFGAIANDGRLSQPSLIKGSQGPPQVVSDPRLAQELARMLETVPGPDGTGKQARVANYRVAGKTGTSRKASAAGYASRYVASFAGFAPASDPRVVAVVVVDDPDNGEYYGGAVAAPLFSAVISGAMRVMNIAPDDYQVAVAAGSEAAP